MTHVKDYVVFVFNEGKWNVGLGEITIKSILQRKKTNKRKINFPTLQANKKTKQMWPVGSKAKKKVPRSESWTQTKS